MVYPRIRVFREKNNNLNFFYIKNLKISDYIKLMSQTSCLIGNSSSGIREGAYIGTPTVNIGTRQNNRECGKNVLHTGYSSKSIYFSILTQLKRNLKSEKIYGHGDAGIKIAKILATCKLDVQKRLFINENFSLYTRERNSKSIKMKNMQLINNKPLIYYTYQVLLSQKINKIVVSPKTKKF